MAHPMSIPALEISALRFTHASADGSTFTLALDALKLDAAEHVLLAGVSGCGKSTLLQLIAGLLDADGGTIQIHGHSIGDLRGAARDRFRAGSIGMIFQTFNLLEGFSARENILAALLFSDIPRGEHDARAAVLLERLGIERPHAHPETLSVGQQQRVAVARALATKPGLVLADEPTASLDPENAENAVALIRETCKAEGAALLLTSHDPTLRASFTRVETLEA